MKDAIQQELAAERQGQSDEQIRERIEHELRTSDDPLARWWRRARAAASQSSPAEVR